MTLDEAIICCEERERTLRARATPPYFEDGSLTYEQKENLIDAKNYHQIGEWLKILKKVYDVNTKEI